jgi:hypothetical protein
MFHKCISCGSRNPIVHIKSIATMAGDVKLRYCSECNNKRISEEAAQQEQYRIAYEMEKKERDKQKRYEYLKREIELRELEEKAKILGII